MIPFKLSCVDVNWKTVFREWSESSTIRGRYEVRSITRILPIIIIVMLVVASIKLYSDRYVIAGVLVLFSFLIWQLGLHISRSRKVRPQILMMLLAGIGIMTYESLMFDSLRPSIGAPVVPLCAYFYLGRRVGDWLSGLLLIHISLLMFVLNPTDDIQNAMHVIVCFVMIMLISRLYETTRMKTEKALDLLSNTDVLTGAFNRRVLDCMISREIKRSRREFLPLCVLMMDIDRFKQINDNFGHQVGDRVLKSIVSVLKKNIRVTDYLIRYGGDEFVIVTPATDYEHAQLVVDKIALEMGLYNFEIGRPVRASIGIAELDQDDTVDSLLNRADQALYQIKASKWYKQAASA